MIFMKWEVRRRKAEVRRSRVDVACASVSPSPFRIPTSRLAFTLVELLIVISILAILSALLLGVAARAGERGREARTKAMIARLHTLVMQQYDTYKDRRAPVQDSAVTAIRDSLPDQRKPLAPAIGRLYALRELMLMEIPDRWSDVLLAAVPDSPTFDGDHRASPVYLQSTSSSSHEGPTPLIEAYRRQYYSMVSAGVSAESIRTNQGAECLYLFVMNATADGEARSLFNESSIGDTDGDGAYEFLDGWGNPIFFLRWPVGFESDRQANIRELGNDPLSEPWTSVAAGDHDPFDMFRVEPGAFRTVPLIFSSGPDERPDIYSARNTTIWPLSPPDQPLSPYQLVTSNEGDFYLGSPMNEAGDDIDLDGGADNIHNHNITSE